MFEYQIVNEEEKTTVFFKGDMDIEISEIVEEEMMPALKKYRKVEINFSDVSFVDSTGIGLLMYLVQQLQEQKIIVTIIQFNDHVYQIFDLLQIPEILGKEVFVLNS